MTGVEISHFLHDGKVSSVTFSSDNKYVVSGGGTTAFAWITLTGEKVACLDEPHENIDTLWR